MKKLTWIIIGITCLLLVVGIIKWSQEQEYKKLAEKSFDSLNRYYSEVYGNIESSEKKFLALFEQEEESLKKGQYASALAQVYAIDQDYENIMKYGYKAIENYSQVEDGIYYMVAEAEYLSWTMLNMGEYSDSFSIAHQLLQMINGSAKDKLPQAAKDRVEAFIDSIFLYVYTEFDILDQAKVYYNKLTEKNTENNFQSAYAKFRYAIKIGDKVLSKQYAEKYYNIILQLDRKTGTDISDTILLYVAISNMQIEEYEEALKQLKRAEQGFKKIGEKEELINIYRLYGICYRELGQEQLSKYYYEKTIKGYIEIENYVELQIVLEGLMEFLKDKGMIEELEKMYKPYYEASRKATNDQIYELLSKMIVINEELNKSEKRLLEQEVERKQEIVIIGILIILTLSTMLINGYFLVRKQKRTEEKLERIANTDYLTGVCTRYYGEKLIKEKFKRENKQAIAIIDIDNFKFINDTYGHAYGDYILKSVAQVLQAGLDKEDIIYRFGGEEFIISFIGKSIQQAYEKLECIRQQISETVFEKNIEVTFSAGLRMAQKEKVEKAMEEADALLYKAKISGKNQIKF